MVYFDEFGNELDVERIPKTRMCPICVHEDTSNEFQHMCCIATRFQHMDELTFICTMIVPKRMSSPS